MSFNKCEKCGYLVERFSIDYITPNYVDICIECTDCGEFWYYKYKYGERIE